MFDVSFNDAEGVIPLAPLEYDLSNLCENAPNDTPMDYFKKAENYSDTFLVEVVPCVFIVNEVFNKISEEKTEDLSKKILKKILAQTRPVSKKVKINEIQIDCDWTATTEKKYFKFLGELKKLLYEQNCILSATIRLHQYKNFQKTGVPPTDKGMLMFYNLRDLRKPSFKNSILELDEAEKYLSGKKYPLPTDLALPIFGWTVVFRGEKALFVFNDTDELFWQAQNFVEKKKKSIFVIKSDTVFQNFYLREGDILKTEEIEQETLRKAVELLKMHSFKQETLTLSFFDYDEKSCKKFDARFLTELINIFQQ